MSQKPGSPWRLHPVLIGVAAAVCCYGALFVTASVVQAILPKLGTRPAPVAAPVIPPSASKEQIQDAMAQCEKLLAILKSTGWKRDRNRIHEDMLRLPGQEISENAAYHLASAPCICIPGGRAGYEDIAFFTDVYARNNVTTFEVEYATPGSKRTEHTAQPDGFWIVGFRDGRLEQVPTGAVCIIPLAQGFVCSFPGTEPYSKDRLSGLSHEAARHKALELDLDTGVVSMTD